MHAAGWIFQNSWGSSPEILRVHKTSMGVGMQSYQHRFSHDHIHHKGTNSTLTEGEVFSVMEEGVLELHFSQSVSQEIESYPPNNLLLDTWALIPSHFDRDLIATLNYPKLKLIEPLILFGQTNSHD